MRLRLHGRLSRVAWIPLLLAAVPPCRATPEAMRLTLAAPIDTWDEAVPLGNGLLGGLLWGGGATLRLSLDRGDLWDERPAPGNALAGFTYERMRRLVASGDNAAIVDIADTRSYDQAHPTKISAGRIEFDLEPGREVSSFGLDLAGAVGRAELRGGGAAEAVFSARRPVALVRFSPGSLRGIRLVPPASVHLLGYPPAQAGAREGESWFVQRTAEGGAFCILARSLPGPDGTLVAATVAFAEADGAEVLEAARRRVGAALAAGEGPLLAEHGAWWRSFWEGSSVTLPDEAMLRHYNLVQYFYGAASRAGAPPIPLQGVWTADAGALPPWKGDYHHDLNTQMTYMGYQGAGRFEEGRVFLDFMDALRPRFRAFARDFYGTGGAAVPAVMTLRGSPVGGWAQYSLSPVHGAWIGHLFYLHWRYTGDRAYLRGVAYPWCREVGECLRSLLHPDGSGALVLPLSTSPEAFDNSPRAWLRPNSNYDIACLRMLFLANEEMAAELGDASEARGWGRLAAALGPFHEAPNGELLLARGEPLAFSHRHLATLMGVYPFNLLTIEGTEADRRAIRASVALVDRMGVVSWCGYSYGWMAALRARIGDGEGALRALETYLHAFTLRNGFHANGDQTKSGFSSFTYRPFTLEGNFLACAAVHEMLLQGWDPNPGRGGWGTIRVFPATPWRWHDASFEELAAEGGHRVSARRENNATTWLRIGAGRDGPLRLRDNFGGRRPAWAGAAPRREGPDFVFEARRGEVIEATLPRPERIPAAPADACVGDLPRPPADPGVRMAY
jgi:alpha-L-fucosidase 2